MATVEIRGKQIEIPDRANHFNGQICAYCMAVHAFLMQVIGNEADVDASLVLPGFKDAMKDVTPLPITCIRKGLSFWKTKNGTPLARNEQPLPGETLENCPQVGKNQAGLAFLLASNRLSLGGVEVVNHGDTSRTKTENLPPLPKTARLFP